MRILSFALLIICGLISTDLAAQGGFDITKAKANPRTFIFDDEQNTVHGYIYRTLQSSSSCCGNDAIYLEVKFDESGSVTSAKTLTGKNECYKKSVVDIVKNVRWDATGVRGTKTIYFEVKPILPCSGSPGENSYKPIASVGGGSSTPVAVVEESSVETSPVEEEEEMVEEEDGFLEDPVEETVAEVVEEEVMEEVVEEDPIEEVVEEVYEEPVDDPAEEVADAVEEVVEEVEETVEDSGWEDGFLSDGGVSSSEEPAEEKAPVVISTGKVGSNYGTKPAPKYEGPVKIPPQANDIEYVSKGERSPNPDHAETFLNVEGQRISDPRYSKGEQDLAKFIRVELKKNGYCGLAQAAFELTISPSGQVVETRILAVNNEKISGIVPNIVDKVKFQPVSYASNYRSYHQFKTVINCTEADKKIELEAVPNMIEPFAEGN